MVLLQNNCSGVTTGRVVIASCRQILPTTPMSQCHRHKGTSFQLLPPFLTTRTASFRSRSPIRVCLTTGGLPNSVYPQNSLPPTGRWTSRKVQPNLAQYARYVCQGQSGHMGNTPAKALPGIQHKHTSINWVYAILPNVRPRGPTPCRHHVWPIPYRHHLS